MRVKREKEGEEERSRIAEPLPLDKLVERRQEAKTNELGGKSGLLESDPADSGQRRARASTGRVLIFKTAKAYGSIRARANVALHVLLTT